MAPHTHGVQPTVGVPALDQDLEVPIPHSDPAYLSSRRRPLLWPGLFRIDGHDLPGCPDPGQGRVWLL